MTTPAPSSVARPSWRGAVPRCSGLRDFPRRPRQVPTISPGPTDHVHAAIADAAADARADDRRRPRRRPTSRPTTFFPTLRARRAARRTCSARVEHALGRQVGVLTPSTIVTAFLPSERPRRGAYSDAQPTRRNPTRSSSTVTPARATRSAMTPSPTRACDVLRGASESPRRLAPIPSGSARSRRGTPTPFSVRVPRTRRARRGRRSRRARAPRRARALSSAARTRRARPALPRRPPGWLVRRRDRRRSSSSERRRNRARRRPACCRRLAVPSSERAGRRSDELARGRACPRAAASGAGDDGALPSCPARRDAAAASTARHEHGGEGRARARARSGLARADGAEPHERRRSKRRPTRAAEMEVRHARPPDDGRRLSAPAPSATHDGTRRPPQIARAIAVHLGAGRGARYRATGAVLANLRRRANSAQRCVDPRGVRDVEGREAPKNAVENDKLPSQGRRAAAGALGPLRRVLGEG